jgi:hypothetical protein
VSVQLTSSTLFPLSDVVSPPTKFDTVAPCHAFFLWSQDEFAASASSSDNTPSRSLSSRAETKALNLQHHRWSPSPDSPTSTLYCYKQVISNLVALPITQLCLHFTFFLARAPHHWSSTCLRRSLSPPFQAHYPFTQWHLQWWTNRSSFTSWTGYRYVDLYKNVF